LPNDQNPIKKIQLVAWGDEADVHLDEVPDDLGQGAQQGNGTVLGQNANDQMLAMYGRLAGIERKLDDFYSEYRQDKAATHRHLEALKQNVRQIAVQPVQ
jgi:hypothetical protein